MSHKAFAIDVPAPDRNGKLTLRSFGGASLTCIGPRGGFHGFSLSDEGARSVARHLVEHFTGREVCCACFRPEEDCSDDPCPAVIADRES